MITAKCGHDVFIKNPGYRFQLLGEARITSFLEETKVKYCPDCMRKMTIKCAWCGGQILFGDRITLYTPISKDFIPPKHAVVYRRYPFLQLVGCLKRECLDNPKTDIAGIWEGHGKITFTNEEWVMKTNK